MSRIRKAYEWKIRELLERIRARRLDQGVRWLVNRVTHDPEPADATASLMRIHDALLAKVRRHESRTRSDRAESWRNGEVKFVCDAGLGGLARWLRAAGYDTEWKLETDDAELLRLAQSTGAIALTTDSLLMERRLVRSKVVPAIWVPPTLGIEEQLACVFRELNLAPRASRCMNCGGQLRRVDKESVRDRIPPKTWLWCDEYFLCTRCDKLFWHGTHWKRIQAQLAKLGAADDAGSRAEGGVRQFPL